MENICLKKGCIVCCTDTQMPLSSNDIKRIEALGFKKDSFVVSQKGWLQLKNLNGLCVFHDGKRCSIYKHRPEGCKLYPVIFDYDRKQDILDKECPYNTSFSLSQHTRIQLYTLVSTIIRERYKRLF